MSEVHPLKQFRHDNGLTQDALAELVGVSKGAVSRWESGERTPRHSILPLISEKTGISPAEILGLETKAVAQ